MAYIALILVIALCFVGVTDYKKLSSARDKAAAAQHELQEARAGFESAKGQASDEKRRADETDKQLREEKLKSK